MSSSERTETPSMRRLNELRSQGIVPHSPTAALLFVSASVAVGLWALEGSFSTWWNNVQGLINASAETGAERLSADRVASAYAPLRDIFALPLLCGAAAVVLAGLIQSRFLIRLDAVAIDAQRVLSFQGLRDVFARMRTMLLAGIGWLGGMTAAGVLAAPLAIAIVRIDAHAATLVPELLLRTAALLFGPFGLAVAVVALVSSQLEFRRQHRMTRPELEAEKREGD